MLIQIKHQHTGAVLYEGDHDTLASALREAVCRSMNLSYADLSYTYLNYVNLSGADLRYVNLRGAYLSYTNLSCADLRYMNLHGAYLLNVNLRGADLRYVNLHGAYLRNPDLSGANLGDPGSLRVSWESHALLSEILWRAADTEPQRMLAAYVGRRQDWCWERWGRWDHPEQAWALAELARWVHAKDGWALAELCRWVHAEDDPGDVPDLITKVKR